MPVLSHHILLNTRHVSSLLNQDASELLEIAVILLAVSNLQLHDIMLAA